jgi:hypothetical protein
MSLQHDIGKRRVDDSEFPYKAELESPGVDAPAIAASLPTWKRFLGSDEEEYPDLSLHAKSTSYDDSYWRGHIFVRRIVYCTCWTRKRSTFVCDSWLFCLCCRNQLVFPFHDVTRTRVEWDRGEMASFIPVSGAFSVFGTRFVSDAVGFTLGPLPSQFIFLVFNIELMP